MLNECLLRLKNISVAFFCRNAFLKEGSSCYRVTAEKWYNFSNDFHALHIETGNDNCYDSMDSPFIYNNRKLGKKP